VLTQSQGVAEFQSRFVKMGAGTYEAQVVVASSVLAAQVSARVDN